MPIYEYACENCGIVEAIQKFNAAPLTNCPNCKKENPEKIISRSSFQLKGGGWYNDGYASASNKPSEKSADNKVANKVDTKTETTKPAAAKCSSGCKCH